MRNGIYTLIFTLLFGIMAAPAAFALPTDSIHADSLHLKDKELTPEALLSELEMRLQDSKLNEMNLRLELEQTKMASFIADSTKRAQQALVIDSLRKITVGFPVIVEDDTLFSIYTNRGGLNARERAKQTGINILKIGKLYNLDLDSVMIYEEELTTDLMYKESLLISLTDRDAMWMNMTRTQLAESYKETIVAELTILKEKYSLIELVKQIALLIGVIIVQFALIKATNYFYHKLIRRVFTNNSLFKSIYLKKILIIVCNVFRYIIILLQLFFSLTIMFSIFPLTKKYTYEIINLVVDPLKKIGVSIVDYIPDLITITIICVIMRFIVKGVKYLANEIANGKLKIKGFYPDWATPTFNIIRFLLYAFMVILIYPYLPGSNSDAFQGVSIFIGLIFSLGASSVIGNVIAGMVLTYMRPFKIGDRIKLNETIGNVIEKTPFVIRIRTLKNEIITIPNSTIMSSQTTNLSASARDYGLIIHFEVTCSYDVPWRKVHHLLIEAAKKTKDVLSSPEPFVLEQSFSDFYMVYQINAYIGDADKLSKITTNLRESIRDIFEEEGISILSPHYFTTTPVGEVPKEDKKDDTRDDVRK